MTNNIKKCDVSVDEALARADQKEIQIRHIIQVKESDWDNIVLADEVRRLRHLLKLQEIDMCLMQDNKNKFMVGQRVILTGRGGVKEIGTVVKSETGVTHGVWVFSPTNGYSSDYALSSVSPLPNGWL